MAFTIPNEPDLGVDFKSQAEIHEFDVAMLVNGLSNEQGVVSGCGVTWSSGLTVTVAAGTVFIDGTRVAITQGNVDLSSVQHASTPRKILIGVDVSDQKWATAGSDGTDPLAPSPPASRCGLALIDLPASPFSTLSDDYIVDKRLTIKDPAAYVANVKEFGASGSGVQTTGSITSSQNTLTVGDASSFSAGHGVVVRGAGATVSGTTTALTSVVPQGTTGSTTYDYAVVEFAAEGGWKIASSETQITNGNATLDGTNFNRITRAGAARDIASWGVYGRLNGSMFLLAVISGFETVWDDKGDTINANSVNVPTMARRNSQRYNIGDIIVQPFSASGVIYRCERHTGQHVPAADPQRRETAASPPTFNTSVGDLTIDGNVVWYREDGFFPITPPAAAVNNHMRSRVESISGSVLTLEDNATNTVSSELVVHDDVVAIQNAIATGRDVYVPDGRYNVHSGTSGNAYWNTAGSRDRLFNLATSGQTIRFSNGATIAMKVFRMFWAWSGGGFTHHALFGTDANIEDVTLEGGTFRCHRESSGLFMGSATQDENALDFMADDESSAGRQIWKGLSIGGFPNVSIPAATQTMVGGWIIEDCLIQSWGGADSDFAIFSRTGTVFKNVIMITDRWQRSRAIYGSSLTEPTAGELVSTTQLTNVYIEGADKDTINCRGDNWVVNGLTMIDCDQIRATDSPNNHIFSNVYISNTSQGERFKINGVNRMVLSNLIMENGGLELIDCSEVQINNLIIDGGTGGSAEHGISIRETGSGCTDVNITNFHIDMNAASGQRGILIQGNADRIKFKNGFIDGCEWPIRIGSTGTVNDVTFDEVHCGALVTVDSVLHDGANNNRVKYLNCRFADTAAIDLNGGADIIFDGCRINGPVEAAAAVNGVILRNCVVTANSNVFTSGCDAELYNNEWTGTITTEDGIVNANGNVFESNARDAINHGTLTGDLTPTTRYKRQSLTLDASRTINNSTGPQVDGDQITFIIIQDATGTWTVTWGSEYQTTGISISTASNAVSTVTFTYNATLNEWLMSGNTSGV